MSPSAAKQVEAIHYEQHDVGGISGSLDCSHVQWMNSPVAHQGVTLLSMALLLLLMVVHGQLDPCADVAFFFC